MNIQKYMNLTTLMTTTTTSSARNNMNRAFQAICITPKERSFLSKLEQERSSLQQELNQRCWLCFWGATRKQNINKRLREISSKEEKIHTSACKRGWTAVTLIGGAAASYAIFSLFRTTLTPKEKPNSIPLEPKTPVESEVFSVKTSQDLGASTPPKTPVNQESSLGQFSQDLEGSTPSETHVNQESSLGQFSQDLEGSTPSETPTFDFIEATNTSNQP